MGSLKPPLIQEEQWGQMSAQGQPAAGVRPPLLKPLGTRPLSPSLTRLASIRPAPGCTVQAGFLCHRTHPRLSRAQLLVELSCHLEILSGFSEIRRDRARSGWYGRRLLVVFDTLFSLHKPHKGSGTDQRKARRLWGGPCLCQGLCPPSCPCLTRGMSNDAPGATLSTGPQNKLPSAHNQKPFPDLVTEGPPPRPCTQRPWRRRGSFPNSRRPLGQKEGRLSWRPPPQAGRGPDALAVNPAPPAIS